MFEELNSLWNKWSRLIGFLLSFKTIKEISAFPENSYPQLFITSRLKRAKKELQKKQWKYCLGLLYGALHPFAVKVYQNFIPLNPNHLGNWSKKPLKFGTHLLEYEVIQCMINLYKGEKENIEGYITAGGTEGNIFSVWIGKTYLAQFCKKEEICLLKTSITHYSIRKAGDICGLPQFVVPLDEISWNMHENGFTETISHLYAQGMRGYILPLTIGYTATGTSDNVQSTIEKICTLKKKYGDIHFFVWIDAALNGLIIPFISEFNPFESPVIQSIVVDFHKFGQVPYPAGIILYRGELRKLIERHIEYLGIGDSTLLGSRPGISAATIWAMIHYLGKEGFRKIVKQQMGNKDYFIKHLKQMYPETIIITDINSLSCGLVFPFLENQRLPQNIERKYWMFPARINVMVYPQKQRELILYKIYFLQHVKQNLVKSIIDDLRTMNME